MEQDKMGGLPLHSQLAALGGLAPHKSTDLCKKLRCLGPSSSALSPTLPLPFLTLTPPPPLGGILTGAWVGIILLEML